MAGAPVEALRQVPLFADLDGDELQQVALLFKRRHFAEGETVMREGTDGAAFFLIEEGEAAVLEDGERIAMLGTGDFFGEIGLVETGRRTASVVATTPMDVIVMYRDEFEQMKKELPTVADRIHDAIRARLDRA